MSKALQILPTGRMENMEVARDAFSQDMAMAKALFSTGYYTDRFKSPEQMLMGIQMARDLGLAPSLALGMLYTIPGKSAVLMEGKAMAAAILGSPACKLVEYSPVDPTTATCRMVRSDGKMDNTETITMEEAVASRWTVDRDGKTKPKYVTEPGLMLRYRALARCARFTFPDLISGMIAVEELGRGSIDEVQQDDLSDDTFVNATVTVEDAPDAHVAEESPAEADTPCGQSAEAFLEEHPPEPTIGAEGVARIRALARSAADNGLSAEAINQITKQYTQRFGKDRGTWTPDQECTFAEDLAQQAEVARATAERAALLSGEPPPDDRVAEPTLTGLEQ